MKLHLKIALSVYVAFAVMFFMYYCITGWRQFAPFASATSWLAVGVLMSIGNAIVPTLLVMLGVFSNKWFRWGFLPENRGKARLKRSRS